MGTLRAQLRQILRRLARSPMFTAITLLTLAVGIGANTAIFTVVESVLLKPLPYSNPDELVGVWHAAPGINIPDLNMSPANYFIYREQGKVFQDIGIYQTDSLSVIGAGEPEQVRGLDFTDGVLPILGVPPYLGRAFTKEDCVTGAPDVLMLSYNYWQRKFAGEESVIGRTLTVDGKPFQIIGVLPKSFIFLDQEDRNLFLPLQLDRAKTRLGMFSYEGIARLKPGVTLAQANADVTRMLPIVLQSFPVPPGFSLELFQSANITSQVRPLMRDVVGDVGTTLWILMASISLVLLIACANVANLLLVRAEGRQQELAIRAALGASRRRIAGELLFESLVIGFLGAALGLALAYGGIQLLVGLEPQGLPRLHEIGIDLPALAFTLGVSLVASLLFGCVPILKYAGGSGAAGLREGGRTASEGRERHRARNTLVVVQVALAFVLLICSGLMIRTFHQLSSVNPGFPTTAGIQTFKFYIPEAHIKDPVQVVRAEEQIMHKVAEIPGVTAAGLGFVPMDQNNWTDPIFIEDHAYASGELPPLRRFKFISPEFLTALGVPIVAGRAFTWADTYNKLPLAMISENFAREIWQDPRAAIGKRIRPTMKDEWREIVGVVGNIHDDGVNEKAPAMAYFPLLTYGFEGDEVQLRRSVSVIVKSPRAGSESLMKEIGRAVWSVDSNLPLANVHTLDYFTKRSMARTSFTLVMLAMAGAMALLLGTVGLYGVIAYSVSKRTREIGIRMALGAQENELCGMFIRQGLWLTGAGVVAGLVVALAAMRLMSSVLFQVSSVDPLTYIAVSVGLIATAALASWVPSRRAASVDPVEALRSE